MATPGWYPDPSGLPDTLRYWDGATWTSHLASRPADPSVPASVPPAAQSAPQSEAHASAVAPRDSMSATVVLAYVMLALAATLGLGAASFAVVRALT